MDRNWNERFISKNHYFIIQNSYLWESIKINLVFNKQRTDDKMEISVKFPSNLITVIVTVIDQNPFPLHIFKLSLSIALFIFTLISISFFQLFSITLFFYYLSDLKFLKIVKLIADD